VDCGALALDSRPRTVSADPTEFGKYNAPNGSMSGTYTLQIDGYHEGGHDGTATQMLEMSGIGLIGGPLLDDATAALMV
jgi:hypothetical protein